MKPAHEKKSNGHSMCYHDCILRKIIFFKITKQRTEKVTDTIINICGTLTIGNAIIKCSVCITQHINHATLFERAEMPPLLLAQTRFFLPGVLSFVKTFSHLVESLLCTNQWRYIKLYAFITNNIMQLFAGN